MFALLGEPLRMLFGNVWRRDCCDKHVHQRFVLSSSLTCLGIWQTVLLERYPPILSPFICSFKAQIGSTLAIVHVTEDHSFGILVDWSSSIRKQILLACLQKHVTNQCQTWWQVFFLNSMTERNSGPHIFGKNERSSFKDHYSIDLVIELGAEIGNMKPTVARNSHTKIPNEWWTTTSTKPNLFSTIWTEFGLA